MAELKSDPNKLLSKHWQNFFAKFAEIETLKNSKWTEVHQLAYFAKRFENLYSRKFSFTLKGAPSKCTEMVFIKKMCAMLCTTNARTIREYIDWVFDYKIVPSNMNIRSLSFFMTPGLGNEFFIFKETQSRIGRATELPQEYKEIVTALDLPLATYGDLAFVQAALEIDSESDSRLPYKTLFTKLSAIGFDPVVLKDLR